MNTSPILDDFSVPVTATQRNARAKRISRYVELSLWAICLLGVLLRWIGSAANIYVLYLAFVLLALLYLLLPVWLFGSEGWRRHIGSHLIGFGMVGIVLPIFFAITQAPIAVDQIRNGKSIGETFCVTCLIFYFARNESPRGGQFFLNILLRVFPLTLLSYYLATTL